MSSAEENPSSSSPSPATKKRKVDEEYRSSIANGHDFIGEATQQITISNEDAKTGTSLPIHESLCSSLLYVLGPEAMSMMATANVLISGIGGLGAEISKNVILGGVKTVMLHDVSPVQASEVGSNIFLSEADIGRNRAEVSARRLSELNPNVTVDTSSAELTEEFLQSFRVVVLTNSNLEERLRVADIVRSYGHALIVAQTRGLFAQVFADLGPEFTVTDPDGEDLKTAFVVDISKDEEGIVNCSDFEHGLQTGDHVTFTNVKGMVELNGCTPRPIKVLNPYVFSIGDTTSLSDYERGGVVTQVKMPLKVVFKPLAQALSEPMFLKTDWVKLDRPAQLHLAFRTLDVWVKKEGRLPNPWSRSDSHSFFQAAQDVNNSITGGTAKVAVIDEDLLKKFSHVCQGSLIPLDTTVGGIVAQEVMKACTGKFMPIMQFVYLDWMKCLPENCDLLTEEQCKPTGSRYDGQIAIFGTDVLKVLGEKRVMVVGAGAIGCEILKNLAMLGVGAGVGGHIFICDMGRVKKSDTALHILFRSQDLEKSKSSTAAAALLMMNPHANVTAFEKRLGPGNENFYNDGFFRQFNGMIATVDKSDTAVYLNQRCSEKFLLVPRSVGTKGRVQVVIPTLTEAYRPHQVPSGYSEIKSFPNNTEHTVLWARKLFEGLFRQPSEYAAHYLEDLSGFMAQTLRLPGSQPLKVLESLQKVICERPPDFQACVNWARMCFQDRFFNQIKRLLLIFPPDDLASNGKLFWSGRKLCPHPIIFDCNDEAHIEFIVAVANLHAQMYGLPEIRDRQVIAAMLDQSIVPDFAVFQAGAVPAATSNVLDESRLVELQSEIMQASSLPGLRIQPVEFEKDNIFHMEFITAASSLRASNYGIAAADRQNSKFLVGKISPTIPTTTSVVSGLVCCEMLKLAQGHSSLDSYISSLCNLAHPYFSFTKPTRLTSSYVPSWFYPTSKEHTEEWAMKLLSGFRLPDRPLNFEHCVHHMRLLWEREFRNKIDQLLHTFIDGCQKEIGVPVWPVDKSRPRHLIFNLENNLHFDFVLEGACILAKAFQIAPIRERQIVTDMLLNCVVPPFSPEDGMCMIIPTSDEELAAVDSSAPPEGIAVAFNPEDESIRTFVKVASKLRALNFHVSLGRYRRRRGN